MRARICSAFSCAMFARVVWLRLRRVAKPPTFDLFLIARTCHALLLATNSCTPHGGSEGGRRESSLLTFAALLVIQKREKKNTFLWYVSFRVLFAGEQCSTPVSATPTHMLRICVNSPTMRVVGELSNATPFRGGFATLNPPLGHTKVR